MIRVTTADGTEATVSSIDTEIRDGVPWLLADGRAVCPWSEVQSIELA